MIQLSYSVFKLMFSLFLLYYLFVGVSFMLDILHSIWSWNNGLVRYLFFAFLLWGCFLGAALLLSRKITPFIHNRITEDTRPALSILLKGFKKPFSAFLFVSGICVALLVFSAWEPAFSIGFLTRIMPTLPGFVHQSWRVVTILTVTWGMLSSSEISSLILRDARHKLDIKMGKSVAHFLGAIFQVVVVALAIVVLMSEFNYDINGLIAGLGLGGLTIALAAKDSAENFFGGLILVIEKPFEIGDWIACEGIEGTVEDISLRSTKIRTDPGALTIVPNAKLSGSAITNWSGGMEKRRASFMLSVKYDTPRASIKELVSSMRSMIQKDVDVLSDSVIVRFSEFSESSLSIQVTYYTTIPGLRDHLRIKERINFNILALAEKHNVSFAFPTRSVVFQHLETQKPPENDLQD